MATNTETQQSKKLKIKSKKLSVKTYCDNNEIPYILFNMKITKGNGKKKKEVKDIPAGWKDLTYDECMKKYNNKRLDKLTYYNAIAINVFKGNRVVVDLDGDNHKEMVEKYGKEWTTKSTSKKLPHIWFKKDSEDFNSTQIKAEEGVDFVYHIVFEWVDSYFSFNTKDMKTFKQYKKIEKPKPKEKTTTPTTTPTPLKNVKLNLTDEYKAIIDNIDIKYINNYQDWLKIIWALYNEFQDYKICNYISQKGSDYKGIDDVKKNVNKDTKRLLTFGTIAYYSKISNKNKHYEIRCKYKFDFSTEDMNLAQMYLNNVGDDIIYDTNGGYFLYNDPYWKPLDKKQNELKNNIHLVLQEVIKVKNDTILEECKSNSDDEEKLQYLQDQLKLTYKMKLKMNGLQKLKNIADCIMIKLCEDKNYNIDNNQPSYFCFDNVAFDMNTRQQVKVNKYDYISNNSGYDYIKPTQSQIEIIKTILNQIMPNTEQMKTLLSILRCGCMGKQNPYFVLFNGGGCNGKGLVLEHYKEVLGKYFTYSNKDFLLSPIKQGANTTLRNLHQKRMVVFSEPEDNEKINSGTLKQITDQPIMTGRGLYEDEMNIQLHNITILECNKRPSIRGRHDNSLLRRIVDLEFTQTFTDNKELLELENHHLINPTFKNLDFITENKSAFFEIVMNSSEDNIYIPEIVKNRSEKYLMGSDELTSWLLDNYKETNNKKDIVLIKNLFISFKESEFYKSLTSGEKRITWNKSSFRENIENNMKLRKYFKSKPNGTGFLTNFIENIDNDLQDNAFLD